MKGKSTIRAMLLSILAFGVLMWASACSHPTEPQGEGLLEIHLQGGFQHDTVRVELDAELVLYDENVTTDPVVGVAKVLRRIVPQGDHRLAVFVLSRGIEDEMKFQAGDTTAVAVALDRNENRLRFRILDYLPVYM